MTPTLLDAHARAAAAPSFDVPTPEEIARIQVGDQVKLLADGERFWVRVTAVLPDGRFEGDEDYSGVGEPYDSPIEFEGRHICDFIGGGLRPRAHLFSPFHRPSR